MSKSTKIALLQGITEALAIALWDLEAIRINTSSPFTLASGAKSPIYINCRQAISSNLVIDLFVAGARIVCEDRQLQFECVAGGESAGIPFAAFLARALSRPMAYVRKGAKEHGLANRVEGIVTNARVLLVEDLITDAGSKLDFIDALEKSGATVTDVFVLFDREQGGREALAARHYDLHALVNITSLLEVGKELQTISSEDLGSVNDYLANASEWQARHSSDTIEKR